MHRILRLVNVRYTAKRCFEKFQYGRFSQTLEYRLGTAASEGVASAPFFANNAGFLTGLLFGIPGLRVSTGPPETWPQREVVLPQGWDAIRAEALNIRGKPGTASRHLEGRLTACVWPCMPKLT